MNQHAQDLANAVAQAMYQNDRASQALGMVLDEVRPGYARMSMAVRPDMLNGHEICHGGMIFTLADSTFAFACNMSRWYDPKYGNKPHDRCYCPRRDAPTRA